MCSFFGLSLKCSAAVILKSDESSGGQPAKFPVFMSFM